MVTIIVALVTLVLGGLAGYFIFRYVIKGKYNEMIDAANKEAEVVKEKKLLEVKEKFLNKKAELEKEVQQRNSRIQQSENKLKQREISLNQRQEDLGRRKMELDQNQQRIDNEKKLLSVKQQDLEKMQKQEQAKLEELSGLSAEEAKNRLVESLKDQARLDAASYINEIMDDAKMNANHLYQLRTFRHCKGILILFYCKTQPVAVVVQEDSYYCESAQGGTFCT